MAVFNTSQSPSQNVVIQGGVTPTIANVVCTLANTEYSYTLPTGTSKFKLQARGVTTTKLGTSIGTSGTTYFTIGAGNTYEDDGLTTAATLYFQCTQAAQVIEIISWTT